MILRLEEDDHDRGFADVGAGLEGVVGDEFDGLLAVVDHFRVGRTEVVGAEEGEDGCGEEIGEGEAVVDDLAGEGSLGFFDDAVVDRRERWVGVVGAGDESGGESGD